MSTVKSRQISPSNIQAGMTIRAVLSYPNGLTVTTEGRALSIGNGSSILIGDHGDYAEVPAQHGVAGTTWHELIVLPEGRGAVVLVRQPDDKLQPLIRAGEDEWHHPGARWTNDEVLAQLESVLWEGQE